MLLVLTPAGAAGLRVQVNAIDVTGLPQVRAYVSVLEGEETLKGLRRESFSFMDGPLGGEAQPVADFTARSVLESGQRLAVALVIDRSGSMKGAPLAAARRGATEFLTRTSQSDTVAVLSFADGVRVDCAATTDLKAARAAIAALSSGGDTALYDAARAGVQAMAEVSGATRRAVVLLTDGQRTTGELKGPEQVLKLAQEHGVRLFTIGLGREPEHGVLKALAEGSGGAHLQAATPQDLLGVYQRVADRLQNEYVLTFHREREPRFRRLTVTVTHEGLSGSGSRKYWPVLREGPAISRPAVPQVAPPLERDRRPVIAMVVWVLVVAVAVTVLIVARRRR